MSLRPLQISTALPARINWLHSANRFRTGLSSTQARKNAGQSFGLFWIRCRRCSMLHSVPSMSKTMFTCTSDLQTLVRSCCGLPSGLWVERMRVDPASRGPRPAAAVGGGDCLEIRCTQACAAFRWQRVGHDLGVSHGLRDAPAAAVEHAAAVGHAFEDAYPDDLAIAFALEHPGDG